MIVTQKKKYNAPLYVDEDFLYKLNDRLQMLMSSFLDDIAKEHGITRDDLNAARASTNKFERDSPLGKAVQCLNGFALNYAVSWENGVEADKLSLDEMLGMLRFEAANPKMITAEAGSIMSSKIKIAIGGRFENKIEVTIQCDHDRRSNIEETIDKLLKQHPPSSSYLHNEFFHFFVGLISWISILTFASLLNKYLQTPNNPLLSLAVFLTSVFFAIKIGVRFGRIFPAQQFAFGLHRNNNDKQKLLAWILATVLLPVVLAYSVEALPLSKTKDVDSLPTKSVTRPPDKK